MSEETKPKYKVGEDVYTILDYPIAASRAARDFDALVKVNYGVVKARIMSVVTSETISMRENEDAVVKVVNFVVIPTDKRGSPIPNNQNPQEPLMMKVGEDDLFPSAQEAKVAFLKIVDLATENYKKRLADTAIEAASAVIELTDK